MLDIEGTADHPAMGAFFHGPDPMGSITNDFTVLGRLELGYPRNYCTLARLKEFLRQETGRVVSTAIVWRCSKRLGIRRMQVAAKAPNRWPRSRVLRRLRQLERVAREYRRDGAVLLVDETELHLNPKLGLDWCLSRFRRRVETPEDNRKLHLAAVFEHRIRRSTVVHGRSEGGWNSY